MDVGHGHTIYTYWKNVFLNVPLRKKNLEIRNDYNLYNLGRWFLLACGFLLSAFLEEGSFDMFLIMAVMTSGANMRQRNVNRSDW